MSFIQTDVQDGVAILTLNDPDKRNALNLAMNDEIVRTLDVWEADPSIGAMVVTGAGKGFCAGADLGDLLAARERDNIQEIYLGFLRVAHSPLTTIAAVNGAAVGAGMNMLLACDVVVTAESAKLDSRFLQIGIHPGGGHTWRLRHKTSDQTMRAMVLCGEVLQGQRAVEVGLAWSCVPDDELMDEAMRLARRAASFPKKLTASTKAEMAKLDTVTDSVASVQHELQPQLRSMDSPEFRELVTALQKKISSKD